MYGSRMHATPLPALERPQITIVICNYNYGRFLGRALESACGQTYPCQVIAVDDGSTDNSRDILAAWQDKVEVVLQPNGGQIAAYNAGFQRARGDVVVFLDADDLLDDNAAEALSKAFGENVAKAHYRMRLIDWEGRPLGSTIPGVLADGEVSQPFMQHGLLYPSAPGSGNAYRRTVLERLFPLPTDEVDRHGADFFAIYGSAVFGQVRAINEPLASYRVHGSPNEAAKGLVFGNARRTTDERTRFQRRVARFRPWLARRTGGAVIVPERFLDFSQEKIRFANAIFGQGYGEGVRAGAKELPDLLRSLWLRADFSWLKRAGLSAWALVVLFAPRPLGMPLARHVCNPANRGRAAS
jgi:glycosyltransferase involved in cell wall biosynthesis